MGKLKEKLSHQGPPSFCLGQQQEIHPLILCAQEDNDSPKTMLSVLDTILCDIASPDEGNASLALRSLVYVLHIEKFAAEISDDIASTILSSLCRLVTATNKKTPCSLAIWCLSVQKLRSQIVEMHLPWILEALIHAIDHPMSSKSLTHEALQALAKVAQRFPGVRTRSALWAPAIYRHLLSGDRTDREIAERCMEDLKLILLPSEVSLSKVVAVDISGTLLPKMERMIKSKPLVLSTVRAWGWFVRLLGGLAGENRTLVNQLLKIVELTFTNQDTSVRIASLVAWEALIDALLQSFGISAPENGSIQSGLNISSLSSGQHEKVQLAPPLKRLKLLMVPLISITMNDKDHAVRLACWRTWSYLAQKLGTGINQVSVVNAVVTPIFEAIFKYGPDKGHPSAWDSCLHALEGWICCKVQNRIDSCLSQALCMDILGKVPSPKTPTCQTSESLANNGSAISWEPWSLNLLDVLLKLVKVLWDTGVKSSKHSCIYLSLNGALRMFLLLVKGVESDGKGAIKPLRQHIDSVHLLLMFLSTVSSECVSPACSKDLLSAVWSLIESLMDLQPLVLSSSFYKLVFPSVNIQEKHGQCFNTSCEADNGRDQQEALELRSCEQVTPIVYIIASWLRLGAHIDFAGSDGVFFKDKAASLVVAATSGINILGNLQGIASVLDWFFAEHCKQSTVKENDLLVVHDANREAILSDPMLQTCTCLLHSWSVFAEHTRIYLERASNVPAVEGGMGDSGYQVIYSFLLYPLQICLHLASLFHCNINFANFEASFKDSASDVNGGGFRLVCGAWVKLYDYASYISTRTCSQPNFFASGLSQKILKLFEKQWQQDGNKQKEAANGSSFLPEILAVVVANVLKQAEVASLVTLAINRKKRLGSFMGMSGMHSCARGSEADSASTVRDILLLTSRILDFSCDNFIAGQAHWLDSTARVLEELARFTVRLNTQHDVLVFLQEFSKPYIKWLKSTESLLCDQVNSSSSLTALLQALQKAWQKHLHSLQKCHPPLVFDSNLLSLQALALVPALQHSQTSILNCTVAFWEATYGSKAAALQYPPCLVPVLSQLKSKLDISLPGWNRGCAKLSRRKSDVSSYTYTGRRRLQMFQEHLVDTKKVPNSFSMFGPGMTCDEVISSQAVCSSLAQSTGSGELNLINMPVSVILETSERPTGFVTSAITSVESMQAGLSTSQARVSSSLDMLSKNGSIAQVINKESTEKSTVGLCSKNLVTNCIETTLQGSSASSPPTCALAPKRKNLRFSDLKTFAYASTLVSEQGRVSRRGIQSALSLMKQREAEKRRDDSDNFDPNSSPLIVNATQTNMSLEVLNCSIDDKEEGTVLLCTSARTSKGSGLRCSGEIKKLGIRRQRFLRSTGSLRGGKFWRDAVGAVKVLRKIKRQGREVTKNCRELETFSAPKVRKRGRPPLLRLRADKISAEEARKCAVEETCDQKVRRKRGRPRRLTLINSEGALKAEEVATKAQDMDQQMQISCEQVIDVDPEKLSKKANMESPFRVQTLNRGIYGKIFSSIATHSPAVSNIASRSHHRKNDFPKRIPFFKDEQQEDGNLQKSCGAHLHQKVLAMRSKDAERYRGFGFATPSKILRSGKRLKSSKVAVLAPIKLWNQGAHLDSTPPATNYEGLSESLATASHHVNAGVGVEKEFGLFRKAQSIDRLQAGNQSNYCRCKLGECEDFQQPPIMAFDACPASNIDSSMATFASLENKGSLAASASPDGLKFNGEPADFTKKRKLCDVLAEMSSSSEWSTMSLEDLDCSQKMLSILQGLVCESKKHARNKCTGNL